MEVKITGTEKTSRKLRDLGKLSASTIPGARRKALRSGRTRAVRDTGLVLNLPASRIRDRIETDRFALQVKGLSREPVPTLGAFRGRFIFRGARSAGYRVRIWRGLGNKLIRPAFKIPKYDFPFIRTGPTRDAPIRPLFGPRVGVVFNRIHGTLRDFMRDRLVTEWRRAIRGRLARR